MQQFSKRIQNWYQDNARTLPWRENPEPYWVVVSEFMLQQTQVSRVIEKFQEFITLFPTLQDLANASKADVIHSWSGLGYNRRALLLHQFAKEVIKKHDGKIPNKPGALISLPGIGPYASGSIASFAFNEPAPAIDVNVRRMYHRYFDARDQGTPGSKSQEQHLYKLVKSTIPPNQSANFHGALMDFASAVCTRKNPSCQECPLQSSCQFAPLYHTHKEKALFLKEKKVEPGITELDKYIPNRIFRGRIVEWTRNNQNTQVAITSLGKQIKKDYTSKDQEWLIKLLKKLQKDSLITYQKQNESIKIALAN